jgi:hypothetical protein
MQHSFTARLLASLPAADLYLPIITIQTPTEKASGFSNRELF